VCFVTKGPVNPDHKLLTSDSRGQPKGVCVCFVTKGPVNPDHKLSTSDRPKGVCVFRYKGACQSRVCVCVSLQRGLSIQTMCVCLVTKGPVNPDHKLLNSDSRGHQSIIPPNVTRSHQ
jgi:hypothetical protein